MHHALCTMHYGLCSPKTLCTIFFAVASGAAFAQAPGIEVADISRQDGNICVSLDVDFSKLEQSRDRETVFTPMFVNGPDTVKMESFTVAGRNRWYRNVRNGNDSPQLYKGWGKDLNNTATFTTSTAYRNWMETSTLLIGEEELGCSDCPKAYSEYALATTDFRPRVYEPEFIYMVPVAEVVKTREVKGRAFIDFKVNQTVILPDYRRNTVELAKIVATIDSVKNDPDITVTSLSIAGTASPEGPYDNNVRLAKGRTEALKNYVQTLYSFPAGFIKTSWTAEDWAGLREWVEGSNIENKSGILAIIDSDLQPDPKNTKIQTTYPAQYKFLLDNVYPGLRHSDYNIDFNIRSYTTVEEIIEVMRTAPQKLSLAELFMAANAQPEGSEIWNEAFEIAVRMYPGDATANLNAGIAAMKRGDYGRAKYYLSKAGNSDEARYAQAVLTALEGDNAAALAAFRALSANPSSPVYKAASQAAASLESIQNANSSNFKKIEK